MSTAQLLSAPPAPAWLSVSVRHYKGFPTGPSSQYLRCMIYISRDAIIVSQVEWQQQASRQCPWSPPQHLHQPVALSCSRWVQSHGAPTLPSTTLPFTTFARLLSTALSYTTVSARAWVLTPVVRVHLAWGFTFRGRNYQHVIWGLVSLWI